MTYKSNLATHALGNKHQFPNIENIKLIKSIPRSYKMNLQESLQIFKHSDNNTLIKKKKKIKIKQGSLSKILKFVSNTKN